MSTSPTNEPRLTRTEQVLASVPAALAVVLLFAYFGYFWTAPAGGPDSWGQFGDFLGGLVNPVVGMVTIILLIMTLKEQQRAIRLQSKELSEQRAELVLQREEAAKSAAALDAQHKAIVRQSFEQTFFAWLENYRQFINSLNAGSVQGYQVLLRAVQLYTPGPLSSVARDFSRWRALYLASAGGNTILEQRYEMFLENYEAAYESNHAILGPMLTSLYRLIDWVDKSPIEDSEKWHYVAIVRSQFTWPEMMILAANSATLRGEKFVPLVERYALLDNLEGSTDYIVEAMRSVFLSKKPKDFPYSACAFSSLAAKTMQLPAHAVAAAQFKSE